MVLFKWRLSNLVRLCSCPERLTFDVTLNGRHYEVQVACNQVLRLLMDRMQGDLSDTGALTGEFSLSSREDKMGLENMMQI